MKNVSPKDKLLKQLYLNKLLKQLWEQNYLGHYKNDAVL